MAERALENCGLLAVGLFFLFQSSIKETLGKSGILRSQSSVSSPSYHVASECDSAFLLLSVGKISVERVPVLKVPWSRQNGFFSENG